jgi:hypothetical protein
MLGGFGGLGVLVGFFSWAVGGEDGVGVPVVFEKMSQRGELTSSRKR